MRCYCPILEGIKEVNIVIGNIFPDFGAGWLKTFIGLMQCIIHFPIVVRHDLAAVFWISPAFWLGLF